jgi:glycosyltransferase involved in cell wall biosynthesis
VAEKTRVLFVNSPTRAPLGADTWIHALIMRYLDRARFEVHAACAAGRPGRPTPTHEALTAIPDLHLRRLDFGPELFNLSLAGKVRAAAATLPALASVADLALYVRRRRIRVIHTSDRPRDAAASVLLARLTGAKCVIHVHVGYGTWMSPMLRRALAHADALIGVSRFVATSLVSGGYVPGRTHAVPNAIDLAAWDHDIDPRPVRSELGVPPSAPVVVSVGRLFEGKGQPALIRAMALVSRELPGVRLVVVGEDYPAGSGFSTKLRALARDLGLSDRVLFTGHRRDVARLLAAADVYAMPSWEEPFGLVYLEAMAMKRPVVALRNGGTPEVVEHGSSGLLATPRDEGELAAHLLTLLRDPALRTRMGEHGRRRVEAYFTPGRMAGDVAGVYASLLS